MHIREAEGVSENVSNALWHGGLGFDSLGAPSIQQTSAQRIFAHSEGENKGTV